MNLFAARVCAVLFLGLDAAWAQSLNVSAFRPLSGDSTVALATGDQATPALSRGANGYLVAWSDRRASLAGNSGSAESGQDIFAVRLDAAGQRIESTPFALSMAPGADSAPLVEWNGQNWLVVWKSQTPLGAPWSSALVGVRVSPLGVVLDSAPIVILPYAFSEIGTTVLSSDGSNWVVAAQGTSGGSANVRARRISPSGALIDATPVELLPEGQLMNVELSYAQGSFLLVWSRYNGASDDVVGRRFNTSLVWQDAQPFTIGSSPYDDFGAQVGSNGTQFLVAWYGGSSSSPWGHAFAARVAPTGQVLDLNPFALVTNMYLGAGPAAAPAFDGANWFVQWTDNGVRFARISSGGVQLDASGFLADAAPNSTLVAPQSAAVVGGGVQLVWQDNRAGSYEGLDVYAARLAGPAGAGAQVGISSGASAQLSADIAHGATNSLLVFRSETSGERRILASRLDALGLALDPEPLVVTTGLLEGQPSVGFDGSRYLITWESSASSSVLARRLSTAGVWLDATPITIGVGTSPEVAGKSGEFLIAYTRAVSFPVQQYPNLVRVNGADGALLGPALVLDSNYAIDPDVCVVGDRWFVVWQRNYWNNDSHCDVNGVFVDSSGSPSATFWIAGAYNFYNHSVSVASSGNEALITWVYGAASSVNRRAHSRRIAADGTFLDAGPLPLAPGVLGEQFNPSAGWNGVEYVVAYQDLRAASSTLDTPSDLYAVRVTKQGALLEPLGLGVETSSVSECGPALVGVGGGRALLASSRFETAAGLSAYRIGLRTLDSGCPLPTVYCTSKTTSQGSVPSIGFSGTASVARNSLQLSLQGGLPNVNAIAFHGATPAAAPFAGGWRCVELPLVRHPVAALDNTGAAQVAVPLSAALVGQTRCYQWWMRDPQHPDGTNVGLSNALSVTICP